MAETLTFSKTQEVISKANLLLFSALLFIMPIYPKALPLIIVLSLIVYLLDSFIVKDIKCSDKKIITIGVLFFIAHIISVFYSENRNLAWFDIEVKLSLFIFPLLFFIKNRTFINKNNLLMNSFVSGSLIAVFLMLYKGFDNYNSLGTESFRYTNISLFHPTYMAMYLNMSIVVLFNQLSIKNKNIKGALILMICVFSFMIYLLESKAGIIIYMITMTCMTWKVFLGQSQIKTKGISIFIILIIGGLIFYGSNRTQFMFKNVYKTVLTGEIVNEATTGDRLKVWNASIDIISKNILFGVGSGDVKEELMDCYKKHGYRYAIQKNLNSHSQYLETFIGQGLMGFTLLVVMFVFGFYKAYKRKEFILMYFLIIVCLNFLFESMLNTMTGVIFFSVFYYLLMNFEVEQHQRIKHSYENN